MYKIKYKRKDFQSNSRGLVFIQRSARDPSLNWIKISQKKVSPATPLDANHLSSYPRVSV